MQCSFEMGPRQGLAPDLQRLVRKPFGAIGDVVLVPRLLLQGAGHGRKAGGAEGKTCLLYTSDAADD